MLSEGTVYHEQMVQSALGSTLFHPKMLFFLHLSVCINTEIQEKIVPKARYIEPFQGFVLKIFLIKNK